MKKKGILDYVAMYLLVAMLALQTTSLTTTLFATETNGPELSDILDNTDTTSGTTDTTPDSTTTGVEDQGSSVIDGITSNLDYSKGDSKIVKEFGSKLNYYVGIVVQCIAYVITAGLTLSKLIDIIYIAIPISRTYLANGYMGNSAAAGTPNQMGGMPGMGMSGGMMGGPGMMGGGMMGRGRYGMSGGMTGAGMSMGGTDQGMAMQNQPARGRVQFVSNAALNAVATESVVGTDGKGQSAFKVYFSDMLVSSIAVGILIVLCITGIMAKFGFAIGEFIVSVVSKISF